MKAAYFEREDSNPLENRSNPPDWPEALIISDICSTGYPFPLGRERIYRKNGELGVFLTGFAHLRPVALPWGKYARGLPFGGKGCL